MANKFAKQMEKKNPAMKFISSPQTEEAPPPEIKQRANREAKSRRLQLLLRPSLYEAIKEKAEAEGVSVNEEIGELLESALERSF